MVTKKPKGLGLGLEALLGPKVADAHHRPRIGAPTLRLELLQAGKYQPRTRMDEGSLYELAESIRSQGVMQPILVRPVAAGRYEIIAGERRFRAARLAGLAEVPVLVRQVADEEEQPGQCHRQQGQRQQRTQVQQRPALGGDSAPELNELSAMVQNTQLSMKPWARVFSSGR
jgi:hypothetical protein